MRKISVFITIFIIFFAFELKSQKSIKTISALKCRSSYKFSNEWQYLSSDLYLLNPQKFSNLINDAARNMSRSSRRKRGKNTEKLQALFIQAQIKNMRFLGGDVIYPIYNFKISQNKKYASVETGDTEVVRLIDNLPLATTGDVIDAEISGEAITQNTANQFLRVIAMQLQNLAKLQVPNVAMLDLIGEMGRYIESKTAGKQYKFSSTIRLYEGQDFDRKLHSINVFVFVPYFMNDVEIQQDKLQEFIDTDNNQIVNKKTLASIIPYTKYPLIVVVNYKSRYNSQLVVGDQINFDYLNERKLKITDAHAKELLNRTSYEQELKLIDYLTVFADLKLQINNYKLNKSSDVNSDQSKILFNILRLYRNLLKMKGIRMVQYANNSEFKNEFLPKYESAINTAGLYLNAQNTLTNIKKVGEFMENTQQKQMLKKDGEEEILRLLYSIKIPDNQKNSEQAKDLRQLIYDVEMQLFANEYEAIIDDISALPLTDEGLQEKKRIENLVGNTYCKKCKSELAKALEKYSKKYSENEKNKLIIENEKIKQKAVGVLFNVLEKEKKLNQKLAADSTSSINKLMSRELAKLNELIKQTQSLMEVDVAKLSADELKEQNSMLEACIRRLKTGFNTLTQSVD